MLNNKKILAIIPARGGSKGLPNKNILNCAGKPLISWTINAALAVTEIDKVVVSTDSKEIAELSEKYGAVSIMRPAKYATDTASMTAVVDHAILEFASKKFDIVIVLQPTSPLRNNSHVSNAIKKYAENDFSKSTLISVTKVNEKYNWIMFCGDQGLQFCRDHSENALRRQDLDSLYLPNGAIYIAPTKNFQGFYSKHVIPYIMLAEDSIDIDTAEDLLKADSLLAKNLQSEVI